jgi:hypothetical protein
VLGWDLGAGRAADERSGEARSRRVRAQSAQARPVVSLGGPATSSRVRVKDSSDASGMHGRGQAGPRFRSLGGSSGLVEALGRRSDFCVQARGVVACMQRWIRDFVQASKTPKPPSRDAR